MTYKQAFDKITEAYIKGDVKPFDCKFCFCGTLAPDSKWCIGYADRSKYPYTLEEYGRMEKALLSTFPGIEHVETGYLRNSLRLNILNMEKDYKKIFPMEYEEFLFKGMCKALDVLKSIHKERGEDVDGIETEFTKRQLVTQ